MGAPARLGKPGEGDEGVAAVIARPDQARDFVPTLLLTEGVQEFGQPATGILHHFSIGEAAGVGFLFDGAHLGDGDEFHL